MHEMFINRETLNRIPTSELYLIAQFSKASNMAKYFILIASEMEEGIYEDELKAKRYFELLLLQLSSLWEIIVALRDDLAEKAKPYLSPNTNAIIGELLSAFSGLDATDMKMLKDIRNKHAFHLSKDSDYVPSLLTNEESLKDLRLGMGHSNDETKFFYSLDYSIIVTFLMKKYKMLEIDVYAKIKDMATKYTIKIINTVSMIMNDLLKGRVTIRELKANK